MAKFDPSKQAHLDTARQHIADNPGTYDISNFGQVKARLNAKTGHLSTTRPEDYSDVETQVIRRGVINGYEDTGGGGDTQWIGLADFWKDLVIALITQPHGTELTSQDETLLKKAFAVSTPIRTALNGVTNGTIEVSAFEGLFEEGDKCTTKHLRRILDDGVFT